MIELAISTNKEEYAPEIYLFGELAGLPYADASRAVITGDGNTAEEKIDLTLEGTPGEIVNAQSALLRLMVQAERSILDPTISPVYLQIVPAPGGLRLYSRIITGKIELLGGGTEDRTVGRAGVRLHLWRWDYWEGAEVSLSTYPGALTSKTTQPLIYNHTDAAHYNTVWIDGADLAGDLPGRVRVAVLNMTNGMSIGDVWVGLHPDIAQDGDWMHQEAETGTLLTTTSQALASNGAYASRSGALVNGTMRVSMFNLTPGDPVWKWTGILRPVLNMYQAPSFTNAYFYWTINNAGNFVIWQSNPVPAQNLIVQELPLVNLDAAGGQAKTLQLFVQGLTGGVATLSADSINFFMQDQVVKYKSLATLDYTYMLVDDGRDVYTMDQSQNKMRSHIRMGEPLFLQPGKSHRAVMMHSGAPNSQMYFLLGYTPRYRVA